MSHGQGWRDSCAAGGVTDMTVGSGDWFGLFWNAAFHLAREVGCAKPAKSPFVSRNRVADSASIIGRSFLDFPDTSRALRSSRAIARMVRGISFLPKFEHRSNESPHTKKHHYQTNDDNEPSFDDRPDDRYRISRRNNARRPEQHNEHWIEYPRSFLHFA
jgi:hypothetical protein